MIVTLYETSTVNITCWDMQSNIMLEVVLRAKSSLLQIFRPIRLYGNGLPKTIVVVYIAKEVICMYNESYYKKK